MEAPFLFLFDMIFKLFLAFFDSLFTLFSLSLGLIKLFLGNRIFLQSHVLIIIFVTL